MSYQTRGLFLEKLESRTLLTAGPQAMPAATDSLAPWGAEGEAVASPPVAAIHRGMSLPLWNEQVDLAQLRQSLANMKQAGVDSVAVNLFWFQDNIHSVVVEPDTTTNPHFQTASDASVRAVIDEIHALGMNVMLKPVLELRLGNDSWRGEIVGSETWFTNDQGYTAFVLHYANLAAEKGVAVLAVGTELVTVAGDFEPQWRDMISQVRNVYSGALVYAAQHGGAIRVTDADIAWWDALDYVGLDAYYPLTAKSDPTLGELRAAWAERATMIETWLDGLDPDARKPVLFTEIGYRSWNGANRHPWNMQQKGDTDIDRQEQADCYDAAFAELWGTKPWLLGLYWWNWEVDPNPEWEAGNWYTPQHKPAERVLAEYYLPWHNQDDRYDVNARDGVTPLDVLLIINKLNAEGAQPVPVRPTETTSQRLFFDVNGDNFVTPLDALIVINYLNTKSGGQGEGESGDIDGRAIMHADEEFAATLGSRANERSKFRSTAGAAEVARTTLIDRSAPEDRQPREQPQTHRPHGKEDENRWSLCTDLLVLLAHENSLEHGTLQP